MAEIIITEQNFEEEVLKSDIPVLVDFWATWCGPCRMLAPIIEEVANEREDVAVCKVDVDECPNIAQEFGIMSIPTVLVFKNGELVTGCVGMRPKADILALLA